MWIVHIALLYLLHRKACQFNYPAHTHCTPSTFAFTDRSNAVNQQVLTGGVGWR